MERNWNLIHSWWNAVWQFPKWLNMEVPYDTRDLELCAILCTELQSQGISPQNEHAPAANSTVTTQSIFSPHSFLRPLSSQSPPWSPRANYRSDFQLCRIVLQKQFCKNCLRVACIVLSTEGEGGGELLRGRTEDRLVTQSKKVIKVSKVITGVLSYSYCLVWFYVLFCLF